MASKKVSYRKEARKPRESYCLASFSNPAKPKMAGHWYCKPHCIPDWTAAARN